MSCTILSNTAASILDAVTQPRAPVACASNATYTCHLSPSFGSSNFQDGCMAVLICQRRPSLGPVTFRLMRGVAMWSQILCNSHR
jgi:hypothetical protein